MKTNRIYAVGLQFIFVVAVVGALAFAAVPVQAAAPVDGSFTHCFGPLLTELAIRQGTMTNKTQKAKLTAVNKAVAAIVKSSTSLATDITTASSVTKTLMSKAAFPNEFANPPVVSAGGVSPVGPLVQQSFVILKTAAQAIATQVQALISSLPPGSARDAAQTLFDKDQMALTNSTSASDLAKLIKDLAKQKTTIEKILGGGGGGGGGTTGVAMLVDGASWVTAKGASGAIYSQSGHTLAFGGAVYTGQTSQSDLTLGVVNPVNAPGTFTAIYGNFNVYLPTADTYYINSGTVTITTLDVAGKKVSGTFAFVAVDQSNNTMTVTQGIFNITDMTIGP